MLYKKKIKKNNYIKKEPMQLEKITIMILDRRSNRSCFGQEEFLY